MNQIKEHKFGNIDAATCAWYLRWWLLALVVAGLSIGLIVILVSEPLYEASAKVIPSQISTIDQASDGAIGMLAGIAGIDVNSQSSLKYEALEVLQSSAFISYFIEDNGLIADLYPNISDASDEKKTFFFWRREPTLADATRRFRKKILHVQEDRRTGIISVTVRWRDRQEAANWSNALVARLNAEMRDRAINDAEVSLEYLNSELEKTKNMEIKQAIFGLVEAEVKKAMYAEVREEYALRVIDPAFPPEERDKVWPKSGLILVGGLSFGVVMALMLLAAVRIRLFINGIRRADLPASLSER